MGEITMDAASLKQLVAEAVAQGVQAALHLDNKITAENKCLSPPTEGESDMARKKIKITLPNGTTAWLTGDTYEEAFLHGIERFTGGFVQPVQEVPTLRKFVDEKYYPTFIAHLAPNTVNNYEQRLKLYILPFMGDMRMDKITVTTIQSFYDWLATASKHGHKKNINKKSIDRIAGLLSKIFHVAVDMGILQDTPMKRTLLRNNGERAEHHKPLTREIMDEVKRNIPSLEDERERLYMALLAYAGMRPEEILGMRWECVHMDEGYCEIKRTLTHPHRRVPVVRECAKTEASLRTVILPTAALQVLSTATCKEGFVVAGKDAFTPISYSTFKRTYSSAFRKLGIAGKYTNYDFRTTFGTELAEDGFTSKQIADLMGHADTRMVETVYANRRHSGVMRQQDRLNQLNSAWES